MVLTATVQKDNLPCIFLVFLSFGPTAQDNCEIVEKGVKIGHFFTISIHTCSGLALRKGENGEVFCSGFPFDAIKVMETSLRWGRIFTRKIELLLLQVAFSSAHILERYENFENLQTSHPTVFSLKGDYYLNQQQNWTPANETFRLAPFFQGSGILKATLK